MQYKRSHVVTYNGVLLTDFHSTTAGDSQSTMFVISEVPPCLHLRSSFCAACFIIPLVFFYGLTRCLWCDVWQTSGMKTSSRHARNASPQQHVSYVQRMAGRLLRVLSGHSDPDHSSTDLPAELPPAEAGPATHAAGKRVVRKPAKKVPAEAAGRVGKVAHITCWF